MTYYGAKQLADAFRTVRKNTIVLAEEIPAGKYDFTPAAEVRTVRAQLAHIAMATGWQVRFHREGGKSIDFDRFSAELARNPPKSSRWSRRIRSSRRCGPAAKSSLPSSSR